MLRLATLAGLLTILLLAAPAAATVVVPLTRAELTGRSDLVVRATVVGQQSQWNDDHSQIVTLTRLRVDAWVKGASPQELVLEQIGGSVDGLTSRIAGEAYVQRGQQAVFFLRVQGARVYLTALAMSVYYLDAAPSGQLMVRRDLSQLTFARPTNGQYVVAEAPVEISETLEHLLADVTSIVRGAR
ncbi:MAG: hypothetical protein WCJ30_23580 [Deltaproteobacteria bacterium]